MTERFCSYGDAREQVLLDYVYEELDRPTRTKFDVHLAGCETCRDELAAFRAVRKSLAAWTPPVFSHKSQGTSPGADERERRGLRLGTWDLGLPAWAQVAAALLFLGISAGLANLNVHYDRSGLTIRTGWTNTPAPRAAPAAAVQPSPWKADLTALEQQLRTEMRNANASAQPVRTAPTTDAETLRRVRALVDESDRRQQRELALRVAEIMRDVDTQRRADLTRISQSLGQIQNNTGMEVMKQRQLLNYYVSMSQKQQ